VERPRELTVPASGTISADIFFTDGKFTGASFDFPLTPPAVIGAVRLPAAGQRRLQGLADSDQGGRDRRRWGAGQRHVARERQRHVHDDVSRTTAPGSFLLQGNASIFFFSFATDGGRVPDRRPTPSSRQHRREPRSAERQRQRRGLRGRNPPASSARPAGQGSSCASRSSRRSAARRRRGRRDAHIGFAACGRLAGQTAGLEFPWADVDPTVFLTRLLAAKALVRAHRDSVQQPGITRSLPPRPIGARAAAAGGQVVAIGKGLPSATIVAEGDAAAPSVHGHRPGRAEARERRGAVGEGLDRRATRGAPRRTSR